MAGTPAATKLTCHLSLTTVPPYGFSTVAQPTPRGLQYGSVHCGRAAIGGGVVADSFVVPDSGNTVGKFTQYFSTGTVRGSFNLAPLEGGPISVSSFESQNWLGTFKITGGTGIYSGIKSMKGGVLACSSPDSVHLACTEKVRLKSL